MKKRLSWAILALVLIFNGVAPVYAAEVSPAPEGEWILLSDEQVATITPIDPAANADINADESLPTPIASTSIHGVVRDITIYPVGYATIDGKEGYYYYKSINKTFYYPVAYQFAEATVSRDDTLQMMTQLANLLVVQDEDALLTGWILQVTFNFTAPTPLSFVWHASGTNLERSENITEPLRGFGTSVSRTLGYRIPYPQGIDLLNDKYYIQLGGTYNFMLDSGVQTYMEVNATCNLNG